MRRRQVVQLAAATVAAPSLSAFAQAFPSRPIKLVIAFPAGGPTDITMRQLAENASRHLGQQVIIENKAGAGGSLPAQNLQISQPDGYTLAQIPLGGNYEDPTPFWLNRRPRNGMWLRNGMPVWVRWRRVLLKPPTIKVPLSGIMTVERRSRASALGNLMG